MLSFKIHSVVWGKIYKQVISYFVDHYTSYLSGYKKNKTNPFSIFTLFLKIQNLHVKNANINWIVEILFTIKMINKFLGWNEEIGQIQKKDASNI